MTLAHSDKFQSELMAGEKLLWTGQPRRPAFSLFEAAFLGLCIVGAAGFPAFFVHAVNTQKELPAFLSRVPWVSWAYAAIFLLAVLQYVGWKAFVSNRQKHTYYALTNRRAMVRTEGALAGLIGGGSMHGDGRIQSVQISGPSTIHKSSGRNGRGSLFFGDGSILTQIWAAAGFETMGFPNTGCDLAFVAIPDVNEVHRLLMEHREQRS